jgi:glycosyltransferase involved in cell wall biosynthesis
MPVSGLLTIGVLTLNEAKRIGNCLRSAAFADQIIVVDSGSHDGTREIAASLGAEVYEHSDWKGFAVQRNRLLEYAQGEYIFFLDADEEITPALREEILKLISTKNFDAAEVAWDVVAFGKPLNRMIASGTMRRLFKKDQITGFSGAVHEAAVMNSATPRVRQLKCHLLHYTRDSVYGSLQKLAQYAQLGAAKRFEQGKRGGVLRGIAAGFACFVRFYILRLGFLCGPEGFLFCLMVALESFFRYAALEYDTHLLNEPVLRK